MGVLHRRCSASALLAVLLCSAPAAAWVHHGHDQLNRIAQGLLTGKQPDIIRTMLREDLIDASGWEQNATSRYPETDVLHWHHQDPEWTCRHGLGDSMHHIQCDGHGATQGSMFCAVEYFFDQFSHKKLLEHYPEPSAPINIPSSLQVLSKIPQEELSMANLLRWFVALLGDMHQPLHWLFGDYDFGRSLKVHYDGQTYTMLQFWEEYLPKHTTAPLASTLAKDFHEKAMNWDYKGPAELFRDWARESAELACRIYQDMEENHGDGSRTISNPYILTEETYKRWQGIWVTTMERGGEHLAFVMQSVIEHRRHQHAHLEGRGLLKHRRHRYVDNLTKNLSIAALVIPGVLLFLRWHSRNATAASSLFAMVFKSRSAKV